jgi:tRNA pseudouridine38-40 synthase
MSEPAREGAATEPGRHGTVAGGAAALLAWDGSAYGGWQLQPHVETVQGVVERVLARMLNRDRVVVRAAGRLDAGVHAQGQVVAFEVTAPRTLRALHRGLNGLLPADIACLAMGAVPADFDPRRVNHGKTYRYRFLVRPSRCPFRRGHVWHVGRELDCNAMQVAARHLLGQHDFTSFRASGCTARHPVRRIRSVQIQDRGDEVHLVVDGEAFLRHQVRIIAGCLAEVGLWRQPSEWLAELIEVRDRTLAARTAPAAGLSLERVHMNGAVAWTEGAEPDLPW